MRSIAWRLCARFGMPLRLSNASPHLSGPALPGIVSRETSLRDTGWSAAAHAPLASQSAEAPGSSSATGSSRAVLAPSAHCGLEGLVLSRNPTDLAQRRARLRSNQVSSGPLRTHEQACRSFATAFNDENRARLWVGCLTEYWMPPRANPGGSEHRPPRLSRITLWNAACRRPPCGIRCSGAAARLGSSPFAQHQKGTPALMAAAEGRHELEAAWCGHLTQPAVTSRLGPA